MKKIILTLVLALTASNSFAGSHEEGEATADPMAMTEEQMMAAMAKIAEPGEPHAMLAENTGSYSAEMTSYMSGEEPYTTMMQVEREMDLGGRVLVEHWQGEFMGAPFEGRSRTGYDNVTERYWTTWTDNWSTGVTVMYGNWDAAGETLVFTGEAVNPMTGEPYKMRSVASYLDGGKETMEMYEDVGQGEYKSMSFTLTPK